MNVLDKIFAGRTGRVAFEVQLLADPDPAAAPPDDAWGAIALWVDGICLTAHQDREGARWEQVHWYVGSFLQWLVDSWDELLHEQRPPFAPTTAALVHEWRAPRDPPGLSSPAEARDWAERRFRFWSRHCLLACRAGGPMPDVAFLRRGDDVEVSWSAVDAAGTQLQFEAASGFRVVPVAELAAVAHTLLVGAARAMQEHAPDSARWRAFAQSVGQIQAGEGRHQRRWGLLLGLRTEAVWREAWDRLDGARRAMLEASLARLEAAGPGCLACPEPALVFGTVRPTLTPVDVATLLGAWADARMAGPAAAAWTVTGALELDPAWPPHEQGYAAAQQVRDDLGWGDGPLLDLEQRLTALGVAVLDVDLEDTHTPAVAFVSDETRATILLNRRAPVIGRAWGRRMALAHELAHFCLDRDRARRLGLADSPWAPVRIEQRARAFAAWLLMPAPAVVALLQREALDPRQPDTLRRMGEVFGVSWTAAARHLVSLRLLDDVGEADLVVEVARTEGTGLA